MTRESRLRTLLLTYPLAIVDFYRRLVAAFGGRFVLMVFAIYGLSQGIGQSFAYYAQKYLFTDDAPDGFGRTAAAYQAYDGLSMFPWSCKALYGLVSDTVPIGGRSRTPYVKIAGVLCIAAFTGLAATGPAGTPLLACLLMVIANLSMAVPDGMLDQCYCNPLCWRLQPQYPGCNRMCSGARRDARRCRGGPLPHAPRARLRPAGGCTMHAHTHCETHHAP